MNVNEVLGIYNFLKENGITVWVDGGWCVDALLGELTRNHSDLDIAVNRDDNLRLRQLLESRGFIEEIRPDSEEWMYVMKRGDVQIDVHIFQYNKAGQNIYGIQYPYGSLTGKGTLDGHEINCIDPKWMFKFKTAYDPKEKDILDVQKLSAHFGFELPTRYQPA